ncbi:MAG: pilus assembly protein TadG-related protein, partial [Thermogemmata sp.]|nr:pilus assembly protein TadG-related protein [Thermogemmata sp.]
MMHHMRRGVAIPLIAVCVIGLFAFVALAVDLGMLAVSRTHAQNAADIAALAGARTLSNKPGMLNNNLTDAVAAARSAATSNFHLSSQFTNAQVQRIEVGQYVYDVNSQQFRVTTWYDVTNNPNIAPSNGSWTAMRVHMNATQTTYFMRLFGVNAMATYAIATAVYRPRDIAFVIDMTGSMQFSSIFNMNGKSHNPDTLIPRFGHYSNSSIQNQIIASNNISSGAYSYARNNFTIYTPAGPPLIRNFYFDPSNLNNPSTPVTAVNPGNLRNAFHRWNPPESGANPDAYIAPTYDFTGYNAFDMTNTYGPTPAPSNFQFMTDSGSITYVGDRWRRADGSINKTDTTWNTSNLSTKPATTLIELLGYNVSGTTVRGGINGATAITTIDRFRDPIWEQFGYDLDIVAYRQAKGDGPPLSSFSTLVPPADRFQGYSMGPGYWGKTFFIWPPDPRAPVGNPGDANYVPGDWRRRYFLNRNGNPFDPQVDNNPNTSVSGSTGFEAINQVLLNNTQNNLTVAGFGTTTNPNWRINYPAVLRWIKSGPQVLPPNLRAGRIVYYTSIPDDVNTSTGTNEQRLDKIFWKNYIDFVLGWNYTSSSYLYGYGNSWSIAPTSIYQNNLNTWTGPNNNWPSLRPYMCYTDSPNRPRLHFWFGPLTMVAFIAQRYQVAYDVNWLPGTCYESQCWQLKAGMNSVVDDLRSNRPNDNLGLVYFAASHHNGIRVPMGQSYTPLKNALFYP